MYINAHIVEVNDSNILVAKDAGIILNSPGIAVINNSGIHFGESAMRMAYLNPRETYSRFWNKLSQDSLQTPRNNFRHHADLVFAHLMDIYEKSGNPGELLFVVPGSYTTEQLSLLLGIVQACPFDAVGLVDSAVAATAAVANPGKYQYIDIHLHKTIITSLNVTDEVSRSSIDTIDDLGLNRIYTIIAGTIADLFIQQSRFDPLHHAETEQALYDQLPASLNKLRESRETVMDIQYGDTTHQARFSRDAILKKLNPVYEKLRQRLSPSVPCLVNERITFLPGLTDFLSTVETITAEAMFEICQKNEAAIRTPGPGLSFISSLPVSHKANIRQVAASAKEEKTTDPGITHILLHNHAYPIGENTLYLSRSGSISTTEPADVLCSITMNNQKVNLKTNSDNSILINSKKVDGTIDLNPGDIVHSDSTNVSYKFIHVLQEHGAH